MGTMAYPPAVVLVVGLSSFAVGFCCIAGPAVAIIVLSRDSRGWQRVSDGEDGLTNTKTTHVG